MNAAAGRFFYCVPTSGIAGRLDDERLDACTDRHRVQLQRPSLTPLPDREPKVESDLVLELAYGWPNRVHLRWAGQALRLGRRVWFYWPREGAIEFIDNERLASYQRLWAYVNFRHAATFGRRQLLRSIYSRLPERLKPAARSAYLRIRRLILRNVDIAHFSPEEVKRAIVPFHLRAKEIASSARPAILTLSEVPTTDRPKSGLGVYLRTDYWARIQTGGSYGHTCYVAKELAATTERFLCLLPHYYSLLDELRVPQRVLSSPRLTASEPELVLANDHYYSNLRSVLSELRPTFVYERICLGNFAGARLSLEFGIPYIVEYNGSEISMTRSFGAGSYEHEEFFLDAERAAFKQATLISVVSDAIREDLVRRGIVADKILVNPNGVDLDSYAPLSAEKRRELRAELGYSDEHRVVGFIGTFGGWHGVDVLAEALPRLCKANPSIRFLLIGDGNFKHLIDEAIHGNRLEGQVRCTGRVAHQEGARLLASCDIFVSPHSSHMVDSKFFGSPTKLFEYMAMGGGIVASDLEQIGEVLSPALRADDLARGAVSVSDQRAVLCRPGSVDEFVDAVTFLVRSPELCRLLGRNARAAATAHFSWRRHVDRLWEAIVARRVLVGVSERGGS